jgi:hypothetical protein
MNEGLFASDDVHYQVQSVQWDFQNNVTPLRKQVIDAMQACHKAHSISTESPTPEIGEPLNSECLKLIDLGKNFVSRYDKLNDILRGCLIIA